MINPGADRLQYELHARTLGPLDRPGEDLDQPVQVLGPPGAGEAGPGAEHDAPIIQCIAAWLRATSIFARSFLRS